MSSVLLIIGAPVFIVGCILLVAVLSSNDRDRRDIEVWAMTAIFGLVMLIASFLLPGPQMYEHTIKAYYLDGGKCQMKIIAGDKGPEIHSSYGSYSLVGNDTCIIGVVRYETISKRPIAHSGK